MLTAVDGGGVVPQSFVEFEGAGAARILLFEGFRGLLALPFAEESPVHRRPSAGLQQCGTMWKAPGVQVCALLPVRAGAVLPPQQVVTPEPRRIFDLLRQMKWMWVRGLRPVRM